MKVAIKDHGGAGAPLAMALLDAGHTFETDGTADVLLIDFDCPKFGYRELIDHFSDRGAVVLQYPHGATANLVYDSLFEPYERVDGQLTMASGEAEFLTRLGIERPTRPIGWSYCTQFEFVPRDVVRKVVFAPTHPNGDGSMLAARMRKNADMFRRVLAGPWEVSVRYIGSLAQNGLPEEPGVRYYPGGMDMSTAEIDATDCVIAGSGTYPALAVARGVPTVMYGQRDTVVWGESDDEPNEFQRLLLYEDVTRYPYDAEDDGLEAVVARAVASEASEWRERWVGEQFTPTVAARLIEEFVDELQTNKVIDAVRMH